MQIEVITIKTGHTMYASFPKKATSKEIKAFTSFYKSIKENGCKKYRVENADKRNIKPSKRR